jgi:ketosteroid isomerase-like protein
MDRDMAETTIRKYLKAWETGDLNLFEEVLAPEFSDVMYGNRRTREELLQQAASSPFSGSRLVIEDVMVDGNKVAVRMTGYHTHPKTGMDIVVSGMIMAVVKDGRLVEGWGQHDRLGQLQQMEVIPETEELRIRLREKLEVSAGNEPDAVE